MDIPFVSRKISDEKGNNTRYERDLEFELMLVAIEEISGHMIVLSKIKWGHKVDLKIDNSQKMHSRIEITEFKTTCFYEESL